MEERFFSENLTLMPHNSSLINLEMFVLSETKYCLIIEISARNKV